MLLMYLGVKLDDERYLNITGSIYALERMAVLRNASIGIDSALETPNQYHRSTTGPV
jgi:hypothetical protein